MADDGEAWDLKDREAPGRDFGGDGVCGDEREAEPRHHGLFDGFVRAHFDGYFRWLDHLRIQKELENVAGAGAFFAHDEFLVGQFGFGDALGAREAVVGGGDHHVGVRAKRFAIGAEIAGRAAHHGHVDVVVAKGFDCFHAIADDELQVNSSVLAQKGGDQFGGEIFGGGDGAEADAAAVQAFHGFQRVAEVGDDAINTRGGGDGFATGIGGMEAVAGTVEEREAEVFFEEFDAGGESGGGDVQRFGGFDYGAAAGDLMDGFELFKGEAGQREPSIFLSVAVIIFTFIVPGKLLRFAKQARAWSGKF